MDTVTGQDQRALLERLAQAREKFDALVRGLRAIDRELDGLATERKQHRLLHDVCGALEALDEIGGAELFWGAGPAAGAAEAQIRRVRSRVDVFQKRVTEIEERRQAVLEEIELQQDHTDLAEDELFEAQEEEERRQQEWVIEREIGFLPDRELIMPWTRGGEDDQRYRKSLTASLLASLLIALVVPLIELPLHALEESEVPERVVRLMMEQRQMPPRREETRPAHLPEPPPVVAETAPQQTPKHKEGPGKGPGEGPGTGAGKGLLAFRESFAMATNQSLARLGSQARISTAGPADTGVIQRSMVTTMAPGSSGGINLASLSRGVTAGGSGGGQIAGVQVARVASAIGGAGTEAGGGAGKGTGKGGPALGRTDEEIQIVFDRHKSALYRLYNRELRSDPTLKGQMVLRLTIEPDGSVSLCRLQGTDMKAPQLVAQVLDRVRTFDFGAKDVAAVTILYPIDFLPAT